MRFKKNNLSDDWDEKLSQHAKQLKQHQPPEELWDKIEARLMVEISQSTAETKQKSHWFKKLSKLTLYFHTASASWNVVRVGIALAAAIILIFVSTLFIYHHQITIRTENNDEILVQLDKDIERTEQHYEKLIKRLTKLARQNENNIEPHLLALYHEKLTLLDESIRECKKALQENYRNPAVQFALFESYRQKVETLKIIVQTKPESQSKEVS